MTDAIQVRETRFDVRIKIMTRKDYETVAGILRGEYAISAPVDNHNATEETAAHRAGRREAVENMTASLADMFAANNPRFNRAAFYRAALGRDTIRP